MQEQIICPCKGCTERHPKCHSECERGIAWKKAHEEQRERMNTMKAHEWDDGTFVVKVQEKAKRRKRDEG